MMIIFSWAFLVTALAMTAYSLVRIIMVIVQSIRKREHKSAALVGIALLFVLSVASMGIAGAIMEL